MLLETGEVSSTPLGTPSAKAFPPSHPFSWKAPRRNPSGFMRSGEEEIRGPAAQKKKRREKITGFLRRTEGHKAYKPNILINKYGWRMGIRKQRIKSVNIYGRRANNFQPKILVRGGNL